MQIRGFLLPNFDDLTVAKSDFRKGGANLPVCLDSPQGIATVSEITFGNQSRRKQEKSLSQPERIDGILTLLLEIEPPAKSRLFRCLNLSRCFGTGLDGHPDFRCVFAFAANESVECLRIHRFALKQLGGDAVQLVVMLAQNVLGLGIGGVEDFLHFGVDLFGGVFAAIPLKEAVHFWSEG